MWAGWSSKKNGDMRMNPSESRNMTQHESISRKIAFTSLKSVEKGVFAESAINRELSRTFVSEKDRALITELVYGVTRNRTHLDHIISLFSNNPSKKISATLRLILRLGIYQLLYLDRMPPRVSVNESTLQARRMLDRSIAGMVNGLLRKVSQSREDLLVEPKENLEEIANYYSHPKWLVKRWVDQYGPEAAKAILRFNNSRSRLLLRVNTQKISLENFLSLLERQNIGWVRDYPEWNSVELQGLGQSVSSIDGFKQGLFMVQDFASQLIPDLLKLKNGQRVLDSCAAPGNKTFHMASQIGADGEVIACDISPQRLADTGKNLDRLGAKNVRTFCGDCSDQSFNQTLGGFDRILVDAPCSNLGVLRHNPEVKFGISESNLEDHARSQIRILQAVSKLLRPDGILLYSVCSNSREETLDVVDSFIANSPDFIIDPIETCSIGCPVHIDARGFLSTFPPTPDFPMDGFFAARFLRVKSRV